MQVARHIALGQRVVAARAPHIVLGIPLEVTGDARALGTAARRLLVRLQPYVMGTAVVCICVRV